MAPHYRQLAERGAGVPFVEAISENFVNRGGVPLRVLEKLRRETRLALHGVSLSVGSVDPIDWGYVRALAELGRRLEAVWISDHLCFSSVGGFHGHDLWPLPYTEEALAHVSERVARIQDALGRPLLLENVSSYVEFHASTLTEWEFLAEVQRRSGIGLLLDVNNIVVSAKNHNFAPELFVESLSRGSVAQMHVAGHSDYGSHAIDDHASPVPSEVWALYRLALRRFGPVPTIVEWDDALPELSALELEARRVLQAAEEVFDAVEPA